MAQIELRNVRKQFGRETVIPDLNLKIESGSFTVLVGPSGCGKSTTLRLIAGLEPVTSGDVWIDGRTVNGVPPGKRDVAMVFQNYALYPTMTVRENIEFGLVNRKVPRAERQRLVAEIADIVGLTPYLNRKPSSLSGGQRQRVALARAMVKRPKVFLMDEPLSNLDAQLRGQMRVELIRLHQRLRATFVFVTHDQTEAMSLGDRIVILNRGVIQQSGHPLDIYREPANVFTARFIGTPPMNILPVARLGPAGLAAPPGAVQVGFRPESARLTAAEADQASPDSSLTPAAPASWASPASGQAELRLAGAIGARETLGSETVYQIDASDLSFAVKSYGEPMETGMAVDVAVAARDLHWFDADGNRLRMPAGWEPASARERIVPLVTTASNAPEGAAAR